MRGVTLLGSTGSIGTNALAVIAKQPARFRVVALTAHSNTRVLIEQCLQFSPRYAVVPESRQADQVRQALRAARIDCGVLSGCQGLEQVATLAEVDTVVAGIVGAAGLGPTLAAARAGKRVLLASKEVLVMAGEIFSRLSGPMGRRCCR